MVYHPFDPEFIDKHIDKPWDWGIYGLSSNTFIVINDNEAYKIQTAWKNYKTRKLIRKWIEEWYKPNKGLGYFKLLNEFN